jgi:ketosteroid isomerase-like protein
MFIQLAKTSFLFCLSFSVSAFGQNPQKVSGDSPKGEVIQVIKTMFDAMRASDTTLLRSTFDPKMRLMTVYTDKEGKPKIHTGSADDFVTSIGNPHEEIYDEKIWNYHVQIDGLLATAWTKYTFYLGDKMSHCGVNAFQLFKSADGWKIIQITDTRYKEGCQTSEEEPEVAVNQFIDNWHKAAARADADAFFGSMTKDAIYIGTEAGERWLRDELREWSKKYFEGESAWDFKPTVRHVYFSANGDYAWFEERLNTWMGECHGSGVLKLANKGWKIEHYHLSVTVPNDKIDAFKKLIENEGK